MSIEKRLKLNGCVKWENFLVWLKIVLNLIWASRSENQHQDTFRFSVFERMVYARNLCIVQQDHQWTFSRQARKNNVLGVCQPGSVLHTRNFIQTGQCIDFWPRDWVAWQGVVTAWCHVPSKVKRLQALNYGRASFTGCREWLLFNHGALFLTIAKYFMNGTHNRRL